MIEDTADYRTGHARRYLDQLCRHFAHKVEVAQTGDRAECRFTIGTAVFEAADGVLRLGVRAPTEAELAELRDVIERHLLRFAFREGGRLDWAARPAPPP